MNPSLLEEQIAALCRELEKAQDQLSAADLEAVHAKHEYEVAFARALLGSSGTNAEVRKADATHMTEALALRAEVAAAKVRAAKGHVDVIGRRLDAGRSLLSSAKQSWAASGIGAA